MQAGSVNALRLCISAARRGGTVTVVGVYGMSYDNFPVGQIFDKALKLRFGQAPVQHYIDDLIKWVEERKIRLDDIITHRLPLSDAAHAYEIFCNKQDECVKVVLRP
jgi:threonine dehydrogenase-like Zn-dependent dehydrogenase